MKNNFLLIVPGIFLVALISASPIPEPHAFYGSVIYANGEIVESGTIVAKMDNEIIGQAEIINGYYDFLVIPGREGIIFFYFNGFKIGEYEFEDFGVTELDFVIGEIPEEEPEYSHRGFNAYQPEQFCDPLWKCNAWGECVDGIKTRTCSEKNNCVIKYNKPIERTGCEELVSPALVQKDDNFWLINIVVLVGLVLILAILSMVLKRR